MVQMRLLDDNLDVIVLVLLEAIPENKMILSLRQLLCKKEYLKWPKNNVGQKIVLAAAETGNYGTCSCRPLLSNLKGALDKYNICIFASHSLEGFKLKPT